MIAFSIMDPQSRTFSHFELSRVIIRNKNLVPVSMTIHRKPPDLCVALAKRISGFLGCLACLYQPVQLGSANLRDNHPHSPKTGAMPEARAVFCTASE
jgi:hypothetical protein